VERTHSTNRSTARIPPCATSRPPPVHAVDTLVSALKGARHTNRSRVFEAGTSAYAGRCSACAPAAPTLSSPLDSTTHRAQRRLDSSLGPYRGWSTAAGMRTSSSAESRWARSRHLQAKAVAVWALWIEPFTLTGIVLLVRQHGRGVWAEQPDAEPIPHPAPDRSRSVSPMHRPGPSGALNVGISHRERRLNTSTRAHPRPARYRRARAAGRGSTSGPHNEPLPT
jgi:hypothetical protein